MSCTNIKSLSNLKSGARQGCVTVQPPILFLLIIGDFRPIALTGDCGQVIFSQTVRPNSKQLEQVGERGKQSQTQDKHQQNQGF